jgi:hypothetical protein
MLSLGQWMAVSGSAFSTGLGQQTSKGFSFLAGFFNVRLGYWWDSQVSPFQRRRHGKLPLGILEWMGLAASEAFPVQSYLLDEFLARFHGPAARQLWNLTDGGHFENTAVYELIRRRVSFIVFCDCGADDEFKFEDVSNLVRKARIDFEAEVTFLPRGEIKSLVPPDVAGCFGALEDFARDDAGHSHAHATLARIDYLDGKSPPGWLLLLKPSLMGDEPVDIREYAAKHPSFPQESTLDQFFDEAQWESYRKLGRLVAEKVFAAALATPQGTPPWRPVDLRAPKNGGVPAASVLS